MGNFSNHDSDLMICNNNMKFIPRIGLLCEYQQIHPKYWRQYIFTNQYIYRQSILNMSYYDSRCDIIIHIIFVT